MTAPEVPDTSDLSDLYEADRPAPPTRRWIVVALAVVVALGALLVAGVIGRSTAPSHFPGDTSAEAGFARDMQDHHAQAVQMALIIRDGTTDPTIRAIAYDIAVAQTQERGQTFGPKRKLTPFQQQQARERKAAGEPVRDIARSYNVSASTISRLQ